MSKKLYLAIETSCDETSLAILEGDIDLKPELSFYDYINSFKVLASIISSQINTHAKYGGVVPEIGARQHADQIHILFKTIISEIIQSVDSNSNQETAFLSEQELELVCKIDSIFVTAEPGLMSALRVGMEFAKTISFFVGQYTSILPKVIKVNHLKGHSISSFYNPQLNKTVSDSKLFPHIHLLVSGGNSQIILMNSPADWKIVGQTLDDAAGECFDKVGRMLGLPYPGGLYVSKIAGLQNFNICDFPVSMKNNPGFDYSFSGLKTAVRYFLQGLEIPDYKFEAILSDSDYQKLLNQELDSEKMKLIYDTCVSTQAVVITQLINQLNKAILNFKPNSVGLSGGVSANLLLRSEFESLQLKHNLNHVFFPALSLSGDNAIMIGLAGLTL